MKQQYKMRTELWSQISHTESIVQGCQKVHRSQQLPADFKGFGSSSGLHAKLLCFYLTFLLLNNNYYIKFAHYQLFNQFRFLIIYYSFTFASVQKALVHSFSLRCTHINHCHLKILYSISFLICRHATDILSPFTTLFYCSRSNSFLELITNQFKFRTSENNGVSNSEYITKNMIMNSRNSLFTYKFKSCVGIKHSSIFFFTIVLVILFVFCCYLQTGCSMGTSTLAIYPVPEASIPLSKQCSGTGAVP